MSFLCYLLNVESKAILYTKQYVFLLETNKILGFSGLHYHLYLRY